MFKFICCNFLMDQGFFRVLLVAIIALFCVCYLGVCEVFNSNNIYILYMILWCLDYMNI